MTFPGLFCEKERMNMNEKQEQNGNLEQILLMQRGELVGRDDIPFKWMKNWICFQLVNPKNYSEILEQIPWFPFLDLAIIFRVQLDVGEQTQVSCIVSKRYLEYWKISPRQLAEIAFKNTLRLYPPHLEAFNEVVAQFLDDIPKMEDNQWYILTNEKQNMGASVMLYLEVLKRFADKIQDDFYIIPSSVHELILVPKRMNVKTEELNQMIEDVNRTCVIPSERLADHGYLFCRKEVKIELL